LRARFLIPLLLLLAYVAQCGWFIRTQSFTFDEPYHLLAGLEAWREGRFARWNDHPPVSRLLATLPLAGGPWELHVPEDAPTAAIIPDPEGMALRARAMIVLLGLLLGLAVWRVARRLFSEGAANFALALFAFSPPLIAHFSLATTDGLGTLMVFLAAVQLARWRRHPSPLQILLLALALAGLLLSKFYAPPLYALALALALVLKREGWAANPRRWNWGTAAVLVLLPALVIWGAYFFHITHVALGNGRVTLAFPNAAPRVEEISVELRASFYVPACEFLVGLGTVVEHNLRGHSNVFLGELSPTGGWWYYFPVVMALKWPTVVLVLFIVAKWFALRRRISLGGDLGLMVVLPVVFLLLAVFSGFTIGDRHILPAYPFLLVLCAGLWELARGKKRAVAALLAAAALNAADGLRVAPDYLSYFNVFVAPARTHELLGDSSLDWGQGLLALKKYQQEHPEETIHLAYYGNVEPEVYGIHALALGEGERATGTVVVSAMHLTGRLLRDPAAYHWLLRHPRKALLNRTLHVFDVPAEAGARH
jgi:hypothetical protein